jgi:hypothetical protein
MLIGLAGQKFSGKTTSANWLALAKEYRVKSFAHPLKHSLSVLTGLPINTFIDQELKSKVIPWIGKTPVELMQSFGTEYVREMVSESFWVDRMRLEITNPKWDIRCGYHIVIDDIRFQNEADLVREYGGKVIMLLRGDFKKPEHPSEEMNVDADYVIHNNGSEQELFEKIRQYEESL